MFTPKFWQRLAIIAGAFSFVVSMLLIVNYIQINTVDPVNTEVVNKLVERLSENPGDDDLRQEIRQIDLLARKAYFTNQWQLRVGGYLMLMGVAVLLISLHFIQQTRKPKPAISESDEPLIAERRKTRQWVTAGGAVIVVAALLAAFFTHNELDRLFSTKKMKADTAQIAQQNQDISKDNKPEEPSENTSDQADPEAESKSSADDEKSDETTERDKEADTDQASSSEQATSDSETEKAEAETEKPAKTDASAKNEASESASVAKFPFFRGPGGNGVVSAKNIPLKWNGETGKNIQWKQKIPLKGFNSPIVWGSKVFLTGSNGKKQQVYCYNRHTGENIWTNTLKDIPGEPQETPEVTSNTGHAAPTMATDGKKVYAIFSNGNLIALDMDGNRQWAKNIGLPGNHYGHSSSLMIYQNVLIVQFDDRDSPRLLGFNTGNGEKIYQTKRDVKISWASPVLANTGNRTEVFLIADPHIASYDPLTGKQHWKIDCTYGEVGPSVAYADGVVYGCNEYAKLVAVAVGEEPKILWESDELLSDVPSPIATKDLMLLVTSYGVVAMYDAKTGENYWEKEFMAGFYSSPMLVNGKVFVIDRQGVTHIFAMAKEYKELGTNPLGEKSDCTPAFVDGNIYIRGQDHLFCVGKE